MLLTCCDHVKQICLSNEAFIGSLYLQDLFSVELQFVLFKKLFSMFCCAIGARVLCGCDVVYEAWLGCMLVPGFVVVAPRTVTAATAAAAAIEAAAAEAAAKQIQPQQRQQRQHQQQPSRKR